MSKCKLSKEERAARAAAAKAEKNAAKVAAYREKFAAALKSAIVELESGAEMRVSVSNGNSKMGAVASVSTLPLITCPSVCNSTCGADCYAAKIATLRPSVMSAYARNTALALYQPKVFWRGVDDAVKMSRYFRFHVSGDILSADYFRRMVDTARRNPHCEILCFTKRFGFVNAWIDSNGDLPENLHILFSGWTNLHPANPHKLPETNVIPRGSEPKDGWKVCGGCCFECACRGVGCWQARKGDTIAFNMH